MQMKIIAAEKDTELIWIVKLILLTGLNLTETYKAI